MRSLRMTLSLMLAVVLTAALAAGALALDAGLRRAGSIEGTPWQLTALSINGTMTDVPDDVVSTLLLRDGEATGSGACNRFFASYTLSGSSLTFGPVGSTLVACPEPSGTIEAGYLALLETVASYTLEGDSLSLLDAAGATVATYVVYEEAGVEGAWIVTGYAAADGSLATPLAGTELTAVFGLDGTLTGSAGCNRFSGSYTTTPDGGLQVGPLASTLKLCAEDIDAQEIAYTTALQASTGFSVGRSSLTLMDAAGATTVALEAVDTLAFLGAWAATGYADGQGELAVPVPGSEPTLVLGIDGTAHGTTGCNEYSGPYVAGDTSLVIGPIASTRKACPDAALSTQEAGYLAALDQVTTWSTDRKAGNLTLSDAAGTVVATFVRPDRLPVVPSATASPAPTAKPTPKPTATPKATAKPTATPKATPKATAKPTATPKATAKPTPKPTAKPTPKPTAKPTPKPTAKPTPKPTAKPTPKPSPSSPLTDTGWTLAKLNGTPVPADPDPVQITADFTATKISGNAGCNDYDATYALSGNEGFALKGEITSTSKVCSDAADAAERAYFKALKKVTIWRFDDANPPSRLTLRNKDGNVKLVFNCDPFECPLPK
jgi:heat shock protein HslJ